MSIWRQLCSKNCQHSHCLVSNTHTPPLINAKFGVEEPSQPMPSTPKFTLIGTLCCLACRARRWKFDHIFKFKILYCPQRVANNGMRVHNQEPSPIEWHIKFRRPNGITIITNFTVKKRDEQTLINSKLLHLLLACTVWLLPNSPWWWKKRSMPFLHLPAFSYPIRSTVLPLEAPENLGEVHPCSCWSVAYNNVNP